MKLNLKKKKNLNFYVFVSLIFFKIFSLVMASNAESMKEPENLFSSKLIQMLIITWNLNYLNI
jgi:hypothetical protein